MCLTPKTKTLLKHSLLYISIFFVPFIPYVYAHKKLRGLLVEGSAVAFVLIGSFILGNAFTVTFDYMADSPQVFDVDELMVYAYIGIAIILIAAFGTWIDSFYVLFKKIRSDKVKVESN